VDRKAIELEPGAEWRKDPTGRHQYRLWHDGWTERVSDFGVRATDPYTATEPSAAPSLDNILGPAQPRKPPVRHRAPASTSATRMGGLAVVVGAVLTAVGTFVPILDGVELFTANYISQNAFNDRGTWVAILAGIVTLAGLGIFRPNLWPLPAFVALALSIIMIVIVYRDWSDVNDQLETIGHAGLGLASGLTVCLIGSGLAVLGSVAALLGGRRS
jgi:hypothetical protein